MSLKNSNAVAVERRMDLASLFCMIGRHGPAVAVAVIAMVSVLAGFIIYRTVRGKRRKATATGADSDGHPPGEERDASGIQPNLEEDHSNVEATELSDEGFPGVKKAVDLIQSDHKVRRRCTAADPPAEKKPSPYFFPHDDIPVLESKHTFPDGPVEMSPVGDSYNVTDTYAKEVSHSLHSNAYAEAEKVVKDGVDCDHTATNEVIEDVVEEVHDVNICLKEPVVDESSNEEKVMKEEYQDEEDVITDEAVPEEKTGQEEETSRMGETTDADRLQDNVTIVETNSVLEEPVLMEDAPVSIICNVKEEEFEPQDPESVVFSDTGNSCRSAKEQKKTECEEAEEECEDYQLIPQQAVIQPSTFEEEINLPCTKQDQSDHVMDEVIPPIKSSDGVEYSEVTDKDNMDNLPAVDNQEEDVLFDSDDQVKEEKLAIDAIIACIDVTANATAQISGIADCSDFPSDIQQPPEEYKMTPSIDEDDNLATPGPLMQSHDIESRPENKENCPTGKLAAPNLATSDAENVTSPEEISSSHVSSWDREKQSVQMMNNDMLGQEGVAYTAENTTSSFPHMPSTCQDHKSDQMGNENFDLVDPAASDAPDCNVCPPAPLLAEEVSFPDVSFSYQDQKIDTEHFNETSASNAPACNTSLTALMIPSFQDQLSDHIKNTETIEEISISSATDTPVFDKAGFTSTTISEEMCQSDMLYFCQDQLSDQAMSTEDFSEVTGSSALVMSVDLSSSTCPIYVPSFEPSDLGYSDLSSPGVGKESGISSMAVSPDLQGAGNAFDVLVESMVEGDLLSAAQIESKNDLLTDDMCYNHDRNTAGMVFGPYPTRQPQPPHIEQTNWTGYESFAANEDTFGHQIEDHYHREMDQFMAQIVDSITSLADGLKEETDMRAVVEVEEKKEKKEKKAQVGVGKKVETKAEEEEEVVELEKTEISIMEATMDNNEWITDSNYQVLPWMNISTTSIDQDITKNDQPPSEQCAAVTDVSCIDSPDDVPATEVKQTSSPSLVDDNYENSKKVLAVQPMPQNVNVTFRVHYVPQSPYQTVAVTGDQQELGNWREFVPLERAKDGHWATVVSLPAESHVEWKFVLLEKGEVCRWEECGNRLLDTGSGDDLLVHKWWGFL
ncbi:enolase-phosphatase E1 [Notolabrus celidotus]|uniref:enolase-phosphatase E1 n=1 Tax=Notolabrus celidotus TaxID=1203425 RepID=UPI0014901CE9|nr:enolase-phosphatase E1 [Notolabrus celidotus]